MEPLILCGRKRRTNTASRFYQDQDTHSYAAHLHLGDRAHEISTVHPAASVSSYLDHPYGPALPLSRPVTSQTTNQNLNANIERPSRKAIQLPPGPGPTPTPESSAEIVKIDVDLV